MLLKLSLCIILNYLIKVFSCKSCISEMLYYIILYAEYSFVSLSDEMIS